MPAFNRVVLVGNVTRDPELRHIPSGMAVAEVGIAINDKIKKGDQWVDDVTFVDITVWGRTAEVACQYLSKGSPVLFEGRLKLEQWEKDGQKHSKLKVVGERLQMLGSKGDGNSRPSGTATGRGQQRSQSHDDAPAYEAPAYGGGGAGGEDIPF